MMDRAFFVIEYFYTLSNLHPMKTQLISISLFAILFSACTDAVNENEGSIMTPQEMQDLENPVNEELTELNEELAAANAAHDEPVSMKTIQFPSYDSLLITADIYKRGASDDPYILLCHQAGFSRGEYKETAFDFVDRQFNCMAIDQRSGNEANDVKNETAARAKAANLPQGYIDAEQDVRAAVDYLYDLSGKPVIILGSSYSSSLVLKVGKGNDKVKAVISFSPGEYYKKHSVQSWADGMDKPLFVTSSKSEGPGAAKVVANVSKDLLTHFIPEQEGVHGSRALWSTQDNRKEYWDALSAFLKELR